MTEEITDQLVDREIDARVYEARYRRIEGKVKPPNAKSSATSMSIFEIKRGLRGTWPKVPLIIAGFIVFIFLQQLNSFLLEDASTFWFGENDEEPSVKSSISFMLTPMDGPGAIIILQIAIVSAGLISGDLRDRAIDLYYSKITVRSYFASKIVASIVLTFIGMPLFAIIYLFIALYKRLPLIDNLGDELSAMWEVTWQATVTVVIITVFLACLILIFSAYTSNPVNAGVAFVVFTLVSRVFFESILYEATGIDLFYALSPISALDVLRRAVISPDDISEQFLELSIISYLLYIGISLFATWYKLKQEKNQ